jgi:hypothetical protein
MGFGQQAWSAAMYLYAEHAVNTGQLPLFDGLLAAKPEPAVAAENNEFDMQPGGGPGIPREEVVYDSHGPSANLSPQPDLAQNRRKKDET